MVYSRTPSTLKYFSTKESKAFNKLLDKEVGVPPPIKMVSGFLNLGLLFSLKAISFSKALR